MPQEGHLLAQHLYVYDGNVAEQDKVAKQFETLAAQDEKAFEGHARGARHSPDPETRAAADGVKKLRDGYVGLLDLSRKAIEASRKETVDNVDERATSRTLYTEQILKLQAADRCRRRRQLQGRPDLRRGRGPEGLRRDLRHQALDRDRRDSSA